MKKLDASSLEKYEKSVEPYRDVFRHETIGAFDYPLAPFNARSRKAYETAKWTGYEVVLDVWQDVVAYGLLLVPNDMKPDEKRPVVVCQHGLEGRPQQLVAGDHPAYHDFAAKLCERGFITFARRTCTCSRTDSAPCNARRNPAEEDAILGDRAAAPADRQLAQDAAERRRPANRLLRTELRRQKRDENPSAGARLLPVDLLGRLQRMGAEERVDPPAVQLRLDRRVRNFRVRPRRVFNYAEMAALICPRPFMVERGHTDGVSTDEWVSFEFAKTNFLYSHRLKIPQRCEMELFDGPHTINGQATFEFLHKHLDWKRPEK